MDQPPPSDQDIYDEIADEDARYVFYIFLKITSFTECFQFLMVLNQA